MATKKKGTANQSATAKALLATQHDEKALERIIRPELNIERWSIWQPSSARTAPRPRIIIREVSLENGNKVTSKVKVGYTDEGALTTFDQRVYYALVRLWEEEGRSIGHTNFSLRRLARILKMPWGQSTIKAIIASLSRLHITPFTWENAFFDKEKGQTLKTTGNAFYILSDLHIERWEKGKAITSEQGKFRFGERILKNLYASYTRPVCLDAVLSLNSEIGQLLYTQIDLKIYGEEKTRYERNSKELFLDLGIEGKDYKYSSARKRKLEPALKELCGLRVSDGIISSATLESTKDGKDYKIVITKSPLAKVTQGANEGEEQKRVLPEAKKIGEENELARRLHAELHIKKDKALMCAERHRDFALEILAAKEFFPDWQKKTGGFWLNAIVEPYELPPAYITDRERIAAEKIRADQKAKATSCLFCKDSHVSEMRFVKTASHPRGIYKSCSHNPEKEAQFEPAE